jgi:DNA-binding MarR family transcriptional regulator
MQLDDYLAHPGFLIRRCHQALTGMFLDQAAPYGITAPQLATLHAVSEHPGLDQGRIAEMIALDRSSIGAIVDRLVSRDLLLARSAPQDRRMKLLSITTAGTEVLEPLLRRLAPVRDRFLAPLSPAERIQFIDMLGRLAHAHNDASRVSQSPPTNVAV